jgi:hypothetical protein
MSPAPVVDDGAATARRPPTERQGQRPHRRDAVGVEAVALRGKPLAGASQAHTRQPGRSARPLTESVAWIVSLVLITGAVGVLRRLSRRHAPVLVSR